MKKKIPTIVTIILLVASLVMLMQRGRPARTPWSEAAANTPEEIIWQMVDAAREGNAKAYLDCFSGKLRQNLQKIDTEMGEARFSEYLKQLNNEVTGIAVSDLEQSNAQEAEMSVEFVFRGRNETQKHYFRLADGKWKIDRIDDAEWLKVLIPYGTAIGKNVRNGVNR